MSGTRVDVFHLQIADTPETSLIPRLCSRMRNSNAVTFDPANFKLLMTKPGDKATGNHTLTLQPLPHLYPIRPLPHITYLAHEYK